QTARSWQDMADIVQPTNIDVIDQDHRKIIELTLELSNVLHGDKIDLKKIQAQSAALENLYTYAEYHFQREERLIEQFGLPYGDKQKKQHHDLLQHLRGAIGDFEQGRLTALLNLKSAILDWWVTHFNEVDYLTFNQEGMTERIIRSADSWEALQDIVKSVGILDLDAEHRQLAVLALWFLQDARQGGATQENRYLALYQAAEAHFRHEEALIASHGLPDLERHKTLHDGLLATLRAWVDAWEQGDHVVSVESLQVILIWWITHINEVDAPFFSAERVSRHVFTRVSQWDEFRIFLRFTGVAEVDYDHEIITSLMLRIDQPTVVASADATDDVKLKQWLVFFDTMIDVVRKHFAEEQKLMAEHRLPLSKIHCNEHARFLQLMLGYRENIAHGRMLISAVFKQHILDWWVEHVNQFDYPTFSVLKLDDDLF
ncbi:MAG: hypothetical protein EPN21_08185, partial [Methylococcaceae bacterium]